MEAARPHTPALRTCRLQNRMLLMTRPLLAPWGEFLRDSPGFQVLFTQKHPSQMTMLQGHDCLNNKLKAVCDLCDVCRSLPGLPVPHRTSGRHSISSTAATVADDDAESLAARHSSSAEQVSLGTADAAVSTAADSLQGCRSAREADLQAQPDGVPDSGVSHAPANGSRHGAATSNDCDPFAETDAALHSTAHLQVQPLQDRRSLYHSEVLSPVRQQDCSEGMVHVRAIWPSEAAAFCTEERGGTCQDSG